MPLQNPNSLDALKKLLGASSDLNAGDPNGMLAQESLASDNMDELKQHLGLQAEFPHTYFASAKAPTALAKQSEDLANGPNFGTAARARVAGIQQANDAALQAGFRGDQSIAGPAADSDPTAPQGHNLYANVGNRSGDSPAQMAGKSASANEALKLQAPILAAQTTARGGVEEAGIKAKNAMDLEQLKRKGMQDSFNQIMKLRPGSPAISHEQQAPGAPPPQAPPGAPQAATPPVKTEGQPWADFIMGKGPNSLGSALGAMSERQKYGMMSTPMSDMIQNESFGNLEQLQAQFPGVRGFSYLLPKLKEHQSHFGQGLQTPQASYDRLGNMTQILDELEQDMSDPNSHMAQSATGEWHMTATPAAAQRGLAAIHDTRKRFEDARAQLGAQYPELAKPRQAPAQAQPAAQGATPGRFTRLPE